MLWEKGDKFIYVAPYKSNYDGCVGVVRSSQTDPRAVQVDVNLGSIAGLADIQHLVRCNVAEVLPVGQYLPTKNIDELKIKCEEILR